MNHISFNIQVTPENAALIEQMTALVSGDTKATAKAEPKVETKAEPKAETTKAAKIPMKDVREALKTAKDEHGDDFCKEVMTANGAKGTVLGRMVSSLDAEVYAAVIEQLEAGPQEEAEEPEAEELDDDLDADDGLDDDLDGDDDDDEDIEPEAVKLAVRSYAKEAGRDKARTLMNNNGAATLAAIDKCTQEQLKAMFKVATA